MWIITENGFVSVVQKRPTDEFLTVRARDAQSLLDICRTLDLETKAEKSDRTDYPYRIRLTREQLETYVAQAIDDIDYDNFKDRITKRRGHVWHDALMNVWVDMLAVTPRRLRKGWFNDEHRGSRASSAMI